jgi:hypothetical protein
MPIGMGSAGFDKQAKFVHNHSPWNTALLTPCDEKASPDCKKHPHLVEISVRKRHDRQRPLSVTRRLEFGADSMSKNSGAQSWLYTQGHQVPTRHRNVL